MTASVLSNWTQKMNIENQTVDWSHCAKSWRSFFIPKIKKGGQAQWQNLNPLTNSELILASGWNSPQWFFWRTLTPKRNELRRNLHRNSTSWNVWKTEKSFWNRSYRPQFRQKWKRSRSPAGPRRLRERKQMWAICERNWKMRWKAVWDRAVAGTLLGEKPNFLRWFFGRRKPFDKSTDGLCNGLAGRCIGSTYLYFFC